MDFESSISCVIKTIQDRKGKGIVNLSETYQEVGSLLEKDEAKGSKRMRSADEETQHKSFDPEEEEDHSLVSKNVMEGREKKRPHMEWTPDLKKKFEKAISNLGEKARPKLILEFMNVPNLNRRQVANHLQRYRDKKRQAQYVQRATSSTVNQSEIMLQTPPPLVPLNHSQERVNEGYHQLRFMRETRNSLQECHEEKKPSNIESTVGNFSSVSQRSYFPDNGHRFNTLNHFPENDNGHRFNTLNHFPENGNHSKVLNSNEFPMNFNESLQEPYLPQPPIVPSLVPPNDFFTGLNDLIQYLELDHFNGKTTENQFGTYHSGHHFNMFNHFPENGNYSNVLNSNEVRINFNKPLQEASLPQPPAVPSIVPMKDLFTGLSGRNQELELENFNGKVETENQISSYYSWPSRRSSSTKDNISTRHKVNINITTEKSP